MFLLYIDVIFVLDGAATDIQTSSILQHSLQQEKDVSYILFFDDHLVVCALELLLFL